MTYDELSLYGRLRKQNCCGPYSMFCKLVHVWKDQFSPEEVSIERVRGMLFYKINPTFKIRQFHICEIKILNFHIFFKRGFKVPWCIILISFQFSDVFHRVNR